VLTNPAAAVQGENGEKVLRVDFAPGDPRYKRNEEQDIGYTSQLG
jgi:hypothetical protein